MFLFTLMINCTQKLSIYEEIKKSLLDDSKILEDNPNLNKFLREKYIKIYIKLLDIEESMRKKEESSSDSKLIKLVKDFTAYLYERFYMKEIDYLSYEKIFDDELTAKGFYKDSDDMKYNKFLSDLRVIIEEENRKLKDFIRENLPNSAKYELN
ncbi:hypothetical protein TUBRATIS_009700 [Tubulinosema ratisbonensis]|uniref:Uncharacterized protein n=1 Tax=Tubulinosema ratisbonensis TaxID=291195 RepID=A0A437AN84_9MICR|nr:hypothetical protein TUBRATIS_009700 [Tubulinosema ratisbonensis]